MNGPRLEKLQCFLVFISLILLLLVLLLRSLLLLLLILLLLIRISLRLRIILLLLKGCRQRQSSDVVGNDLKGCRPRQSFDSDRIEQSPHSSSSSERLSPATIL